MIIKTKQIQPSPYQHRRSFHVDDLALSIQRDGLIEPIVVRRLDGGDQFELIAGERRLRAVKTFSDTILSRVVDATDIQSRRMCAAENMQRENVSAAEEVEAIVDMVDAELMEVDEYTDFGDSPEVRVRFLLGKLNNDDRHGTDFFANKFISKIESIFKSLPRKKAWHSFFMNDLPLIKLDDEVLDIAADNQLNKSQTKAVAKMRRDAPKAFNALTAKADKNGVIKSGTDSDGEDVSLADVSADKLIDMADQERDERESREQRQQRIKEASEVAPVDSDQITIINGDCINGLKSLADESVDLIATDPPYNMDKAEWDSFGSGEDFAAWCEQWLVECKRVLKPSGSIYIFGINRMLSHLQRWLDSEMVYRNWIVWDTVQGAGGGLWVNRHESVLYYSKTDKTYEDKESIKLERHEENIREYKGKTYEFKNPSNVWRFPCVDGASEERTDHITQKPVDIMRRIIRASAPMGGMVVDPFIGSGTTAIAAYREGRRFTGYEIDKPMSLIANERVSNEISS
ncbi:MAG: hypothetical protein DRR06_18750 [Gammaproteobacteria bacterium]|nr:MAG: hypothetical protein DRR06_18750 [Gammaproteobacteria bacterium]